MSTGLEGKLLRIDVLAAVQAATFARDSDLPLSLHLVPAPVRILVFLASAVCFEDYSTSRKLLHPGSNALTTFTATFLLLQLSFGL